MKSLSGAFPFAWLAMDEPAQQYAHKKGEVVGPAGGETGVPRCLAEVHKLLIAASFRHSKNRKVEFNSSQKTVKQKK